jgi:hypothetical protein
VAKGCLAIAGAVVLAACHGHHEAGPPPLGKALSAVLAAADVTRVPWRCTTPTTTALTDETRDGWQVGDHSLTSTAARPELRIGIVSDTGGSAPATLAALARLRVKLGAADLVVTLGGMGTTRSELEATLGTLADKAPWPVVALPGDLEDEDAQVAAIAALRGKGSFVLDGRQVRWIAADTATLATVPGAGAKERLVAGGDGCAWRTADVAKIYDELAGKPGLRIALASEAPRAGGTGELPLVPPPGIDVVVHGASRLSPAMQGKRGTTANLSPGTADASPRLPETHAPSAGLLVIRGTAWSWQPLVDGK